jgi:hypothetical protein
LRPPPRNGKARGRDPAGLVVCTRNDGYSASLVVGRSYRRLDDAAGARLGLLRVVDESGEDYLFPETFFRPARQRR